MEVEKQSFAQIITEILNCFQLCPSTMDERIQNGIACEIHRKSLQELT